ncbi:MAG: flavin reductase [Anaerococcus sp.]|nr:flavin reductase [Anaerococcus sp.]
MKFDEVFKGYDKFNKDWALASAGSIEDFNGCTIGWGSLGSIWDSGGIRRIITIYIHPARLTCKYLLENDYFTISFFDKADKEKLAYMGSHSGRDDKYKAETAGLSPIEVGESVGYEQASLTLLVKKHYQGQFTKEGLSDEIKDYYSKSPKVYPDFEGGWQAHYVFVGEIIEIKEN